MRSAFAASLLALAALCACSKQTDSGKPLASASANASLFASAAPNASALPAGSVPHLPQVKPSCRALAVTGKATADGSPIGVGTLLDGEHWVELEAGSSVSLRHTLTTRELKLIGPGLVLPCWHGAEQVLLAEGKLSTSSNLGVRPGAEVLIATPVGTIHYGDAAIDVQFGQKGLRLRVKEGEAWLAPRDPAAPPVNNPLRSPQEAALPASKVTPSALADACKASAETAAGSARRVLGLGSVVQAGSLGTRAAAHMRDRAAARAACATAAAATGSVTDPAERQSLWVSIAHSDEVWQSVPRGISAQKN
jgi:hypothetical protein